MTTITGGNPPGAYPVALKKPASASSRSLEKRLESSCDGALRANVLSRERTGNFARRAPGKDTRRASRRRKRSRFDRTATLGDLSTGYEGSGVYLPKISTCPRLMLIFEVAESSFRLGSSGRIVHAIKGVMRFARGGVSGSIPTEAPTGVSDQALGSPEILKVSEKSTV